MKRLGAISIGFIVIYVTYFLLHGSSFYAYSDQLHLDKIFHIAGGFLVAAFVALFFNTRRWWVFCFASFFVGIGWEVFEGFLLSPWLFQDLQDIVFQNIRLHDVALVEPPHISWDDVVADVMGAFLYWDYTLSASRR